MKALHEYTALELRQMLWQEEITAEALTRYFLRRIAAYDQPCQLNAVAFFDPTSIRQAKHLDSIKNKKDYPLFGLPVLVKDNVDVAGLPTTAGSCLLTDNIALKDAPIVAKLRKNGAVILGKTNMTEFANYVADDMPNGFSSRGGQVRCAYKADHDPSGSSTGSAVAVSAGFCAFAVGTDTCFSIVGCATEHGVVGFKPTHGRLSCDGIIPISASMDSAGPIAKTLQDAILLYKGMGGSMAPVQPAHVKGLRLAVNMAGFDEREPAVKAQYEGLMQALQKDGASITELSHPWVPEQSLIHRCEFREDLEKYLANTKVRRGTLGAIIDGYRADPEKRMPYGIGILERAMVHDRTMPAYRDAMTQRADLRKQLEETLKNTDACLMAGLTNIMHFAGLPSVTIPFFQMEDGAPWGLILYGTEERRLLAAVETISHYCPGIPAPCLSTKNAL